MEPTKESLPSSLQKYIQKLSTTSTGLIVIQNVLCNPGTHLGRAVFIAKSWHTWTLERSFCPQSCSIGSRIGRRNGRNKIEFPMRWEKSTRSRCPVQTDNWEILYRPDFCAPISTAEIAKFLLEIWLLPKNQIYFLGFMKYKLMGSTYICDNGFPMKNVSVLASNDYKMASYSQIKTFLLIHLKKNPKSQFWNSTFTSKFTLSNFSTWDSSNGAVSWSNLPNFASPVCGFTLSISETSAVILSPFKFSHKVHSELSNGVQQ